jgi:site-specific recombinase XerD
MPRAATASNVVPLPNAAPSPLMSDMAWWADVLRAKNRSGATIESYRLTLSTFDRFLSDRGYPRATDEITRQHVQQFITDQRGKDSAGPPTRISRG